jgi:integrase
MLVFIVTIRFMKESGSSSKQSASKHSSSRHSGSGTIYQRGDIWWVKIHVDGRPVYESSKSTKHADAVKLRDKLLAKKVRGEVSGGSPNRVLISELLDDVLKSDIADSTRYVWGLVVEKNLRPFFGRLKATRLTTDKMDEYRARRKKEGRTDATVNRELSIVRTAYHNARKRTPPKVHVVPYFPMITETHVRQGFLTDDQYAKLRDALGPDLRPLFVCGYETGVRRSELLSCEWDWIDFDSGTISLPSHVTKTKEGRTVPIIDGDMRDLLTAAKQERDANWPDSKWVFNRQGEQIISFRSAWDKAATVAGVPELTFHDLRRTAVRNMRRAGVPQVIRMAISGHKTDSMERRYNIVDGDDLEVAKKFMAARKRSQ